MNFTLVSLYLAASISILTHGAQLPPTQKESFKAYQNFKQALIEKFHIPHQDLSLPSKIIPSIDCEIQIKDVSDYGDRIFVEVSRGPQSWFMTVKAGEPTRFSQNTQGFIFNAYTQDCEEQGCDGHWYVTRSFLVKDSILEVSATEPYSHALSSLICRLD